MTKTKKEVQSLYRMVLHIAIVTQPHTKIRNFTVELMGIPYLLLSYKRLAGDHHPGHHLAMDAAAS